ncbi:hypothetical protein F5883DRAFT_51785 [Diaporthe sp. PMI_573]|nr:hypothetical protein F5883DRAFT_51785 [Diaporthaceae sp. PMI_573]
MCLACLACLASLDQQMLTPQHHRGKGAILSSQKGNPTTLTRQPEEPRLGINQLPCKCLARNTASFNHCSFTAKHHSDHARLSPSPKRTQGMHSPTQSLWFGRFVQRINFALDSVSRPLYRPPQSHLPPPYQPQTLCLRASSFPPVAVISRHLCNAQDKTPNPPPNSQFPIPNPHKQRHAMPAHE